MSREALGGCVCFSRSRSPQNRGRETETSQPNPLRCGVQIVAEFPEGDAATQATTRLSLDIIL